LFTPLNLALVVFELAVMIFSISLHDVAQAFAANRLGDPTGRMLGRVSLNPMKHFDVWGMLVFPLLFILRSPLVLGWGKPVPMTYRNFRKRNGEILAVLAGPVAQLAAAVVALMVMVALKHTIAGAAYSLNFVEALAFRAPVEGLANAPGIFPVLLLLYLCIMINLLLCVFNMLPMPFLDGGRILSYFLPYNAQKAFERYSFYFMIAFFFLGFQFIMIAFDPLFFLFNALLQRM
jgi:Zn-dependent protease